MIGSRLVPSPLVRFPVRVPVVVALPRARRHRTWEVVRTLGGALWTSLVRYARGSLTAGEAGVLLRAAFESLGGAWIKVSHLLAVAHALLPPEFRNELMALYHRSPGFPPELARRAIEEDLGKPVDDLFEQFVDHPVAAGSTGQVHAAILRREGERVLVKVRRPDIEETWHRDLRLMRTLAWLGSHIGKFRAFRLREMAQEMEGIFSEELDYRREAAHLKRLRKALRRAGVIIPRTWTKYASERVLVVEHLQGVFASEVLAEQEKDPDRLRTWLAENDVHPRKVVRRLYRAHIRQLLEGPCFHADPHPGNILLLRHDRVALIDFASVGRLDGADQTTYGRFLHLLSIREYREAVERFIRLLEPIPPVDLNALRSDLLRVFRLWDADTRLYDLPYDQRSFLALMADVARVCWRYRIPLESSYVRVDRGFYALDATIRHLDDKIDYPRELGRHFRRSRRRRLLALRPAGPPIETIATHFDPDQRVAEAGENFRSIVRRNAIRFEAGSSKSELALSILLGQMRLVPLAIGVLLLAAFVWPAGGGADAAPTDLMAHVGSFVRDLSGWDWGLVGLVVFVAYRSLSRARQRIQRAESRSSPILQ